MEKLQLCSDLFLQVLLLRLQPKSQSAALNMPKLPGSKLSVLQLIWVNNLFAVRKTFSCTSNCFWMNYWVKKKGHFQPQGISETPVYTSLSRSPLLQHRTTKREKKTLLQTPWYAINQPVRLTAVLSTDLRGHPVFALTRSLSADNTAPCRNKTQLQVTAERCETNTKTPQINTSVSLCALRVKELLLQKTPSPRITVSTLVFSLSPPHRSSSVWPALDQGQAGATYLFSSWVESLRQSGAMGRWTPPITRSRWRHQVTFKLHALHRRCSPSNGVHIYD